MEASSPSGSAGSAESAGSAGSAGVLGRRIAAGLASLTLEKVTEVGFANAAANAPYIRKGRSILDLRDTPLFRADAAIVISAGPSLHRKNIVARLKASRFGGVIIACDSAMSWCLRQELVPHLVVSLDPHPTRIVRWFGDPDLTMEQLAKDDYFARQDLDPEFRNNQLRTNAALIEQLNRHGPSIRLAICSAAAPRVVQRTNDAGMQLYWWNPFYDDYDADDSLTRRIHRQNGLPCLNAGGNVGTSCWAMAAEVLEIPRIALLGMDLSYFADTPYSNTQYYREILDLVGPDRLDEVYMRIRNPHTGEDFYTDPAYLWFRDCFLEAVQETAAKTYNCSESGILFGEGINFVSLEQFLAE